MFRFAPRLLAAFALVASAVLTLAQAQGGAYNLPVRAVISYANLLTPELVAELEPAYREDDDLAFAIVEGHVADGTVSAAVAEGIKLALTNGILPHEGFVIYLADVFNGPEAAPTSLEFAQAQLDEAGVSYPLADANGNVSETTLTEALTEPEPLPVTASDDDNDYDEELSPTSGS